MRLPYHFVWDSNYFLQSWTENLCLLAKLSKRLSFLVLFLPYSSSLFSCSTSYFCGQWLSPSSVSSLCGIFLSFLPLFSLCGLSASSYCLCSLTTILLWMSAVVLFNSNSVGVSVGTSIFQVFFLTSLRVIIKNFTVEFKNKTKPISWPAKCMSMHYILILFPIKTPQAYLNATPCHPLVIKIQMLL